MNRDNFGSIARFPLLCLILMLSAAALSAQNAPKSTSPRLVQMPEGYSAWKVEVSETPPSPGTEKTSPSQPQKPAPSSTKSPQTVGLPSRVEVTQDDEKRRCIVHWASGKDQTSWEYPRYKVVLSEGFSGNVTAAMAGNPDFTVPFVSGAFDWITPQCLVEPQPVSFQGKQCFHYKGSVAVRDAKFQITHSLKLEAWIDSTTLLPVGLHDGSALGIYTFQESAEKLTLPPKFLAKLSYFITVIGAGPYQPSAKRPTMKPVAR